MAVATYEYRINGGTPVEALTWPTVSLTGLAPGTMFEFEVRAKDTAGNYSAWSRKFYATTSYLLGFLADNDGNVIIDDSGDAIAVLQGNLYGRA